MEHQAWTDIMTIREVAEYLRLAPSTVYKLAREGQLPGRKIGGAWRFSRAGLDEWVRHPLGNSTDWRLDIGDSESALANLQSPTSGHGVGNVNNTPAERGINGRAQGRQPV